MSRPKGLWPITLVLMILKLSGVLNISWTWVLAPIWIPVVLVLAMVAVFAILGAIFIVVEKWTFKKDQHH